MKKYIKFLTAILSGALLITGLYQVEIMWIQRAWEFERFVMPFGIEVEWWIAKGHMVRLHRSRLSTVGVRLHSRWRKNQGEAKATKEAKSSLLARFRGTLVIRKR